MATIERFEDILAWQKTRELCKLIQKYTLRDPLKHDFDLISQIKGSSGSAIDNIAEGFERGGNREFIQFLFISKGSTGETKSQLYRALDNKYISEEEFTLAYNLADEVCKLNGGFINHLKSSNISGSKYK